jgi:hypothetical protein
VVVFLCEEAVAHRALDVSTEVVGVSGLVDGVADKRLATGTTQRSASVAATVGKMGLETLVVEETGLLTLGTLEGTVLGGVFVSSEGGGGREKRDTLVAAVQDTVVVIYSRKSKFAKTPLAPLVILISSDGSGQPIDLSDQKKVPLIFSCMIVKKDIDGVLAHDLGVGLCCVVETGAFVKAVDFDTSIWIENDYSIGGLHLLDPFTESGKWKARVGACIGVAKKLTCQTESLIVERVGFLRSTKIVALAFVQETEDEGPCAAIPVFRVLDMTGNEKAVNMIEMIGKTTKGGGTPTKKTVGNRIEDLEEPDEIKDVSEDVADHHVPDQVEEVVRLNVGPNVSGKGHNAWRRSWICKSSIASIHAASGSVNAANDDPLAGLYVGLDLDGEEKDTKVREDGKVVVFAGAVAYSADDGLVGACAGPCCCSYRSNVDLETGLGILESTGRTIGNGIVFKATVLTKVEELFLNFFLSEILELAVSNLSMGLEESLMSSTLARQPEDVHVREGVDERPCMAVGNLTELGIGFRKIAEDVVDPSFESVCCGLRRIEATTCSPFHRYVNCYCTKCSR